MADGTEIPLEAVTALSAHLLEQGSLDEVLRRVSEASVQYVHGAEEASVSLVEQGRPTTYGATGGLPLAADERQYEAGTGPCLESARTHQVVLVEDARTDERFGDVLAAMAREGVLSSLSAPLPVRGEVIGALNVYARHPSTFDATSVAVAERLAAFAGVAVANAIAYARVSAEAEQMQQAMASRSIIEQAKGIIMGRVGCDADAAFQLLVEQSQHENRKLRDLAVELVERAARGRQ